MSKRKGGGKGQEETKLQIMERIAPKKFMSYGIPAHKQFMSRIEGYLDEDNDFEQVGMSNRASYLGGSRTERY